MALIPSMLLRQLYTFGSLKNTGRGIQFAIKNRLSDAEVTELQRVSIDGELGPETPIEVSVAPAAVKVVVPRSPNRQG